MDRMFLWIKILLAVAVLVSGMALAKEALEACDACTVKMPISIALLGTCFYGALLLGAFVFGPAPFIFAGIMIAGAAHGVLVGHMMSASLWCPLCILAAVNSGTLILLALAFDPQNLLRAAALLPVTAATVMIVLFIVGRAQTLQGARTVESARSLAPRSDVVSVVVFEKADCPYCIELRERVMPELESEFGASVRVVYHPASSMPGITHTPTLVVLPPGEADGEVIEGLPTYERLREAVARALAGKRS